MKKIIVFLSLLFILFQLNAQGSVYKIEKPENLMNSKISIETNWDFYWGKFVPPYDKNSKPDIVVSAPSDWNKYPLSDDIQKITKTGKGSGTYRLTLTNLIPNTKYVFPVYKLAYTAFTIYADNELIYQAGNPVTEWENTIAEQNFETAAFFPKSDGTVTLTIFVSNDIYRKGGLRGKITLCEEQYYKDTHYRSLCSYSIFSGILLMIVLYSILIFIIKKEKSYLYLALLILTIYTRIVSSIFPLLKTLFPALPFSMMLKIEFISIFCIPGFITLYIDSLNKNIFKYIPAKILAVPSYIFLILDFVLPIHLANRLVPFEQIYMYSILTIDSLLFILSTIKKPDFLSSLAILSLVFLAIGATGDILLINHISFLHGLQLLAPSFVQFAIWQIILLAYIQNKNYQNILDINQNLVEMNKAYYRFVPKEFLELLSKKDITEVQLGEYKVSKAAVLSADIRNFTAISEKLVPIQVFDLLNSYLRRVAPLIRKYNGIIEKYLGDGIIAIFPNSAEAALNCAIEIQEEMIKLREEFSERGMPQIRIGIGIHYGNIVIGTGGNNERMTEISLSKDIDIAIKTESETKIFKHPILATVQAISNAANEARKEGRKFSFCGKTVTENSNLHDKSLKLFSIYNEKIGDVL